MIEYIFYDLPKVSLNSWYSGTHWSKRKKLKDEYKWLIRVPHVATPCKCEYHFEFKSRPLDCSNTIAMVKMIEDCIFSDDGVNVVQEIKVSSRKGKRDKVTIKINLLLE